MCDIFHPYGRICKDLRISGDQFTAHKSNIIRRSIMIPGFCQTAAICKMSVFHSEFCCPFVHLFHKSLFRSGKMFCHCHTGIISGSDHNTLDHSLCFLCFSFFQKYLGTAHGFCISTCCNGIIQMKFSIFDCIKNKDQCHDLRNAGRTSSGIRIPGIDHCTRFFLHKNCRRCFDKLFSTVFCILRSFSPYPCRRQNKTYDYKPDKKKFQLFPVHRLTPTVTLCSIVKDFSQKYS